MDSSLVSNVSIALAIATLLTVGQGVLTNIRSRMPTPVHWIVTGLIALIVCERGMSAIRVSVDNRATMILSIATAVLIDNFFSYKCKSWNISPESKCCSSNLCQTMQDNEPMDTSNMLTWENNDKDKSVDQTQPQQNYGTDAEDQPKITTYASKLADTSFSLWNDSGELFGAGNPINAIMAGFSGHQSVDFDILPKPLSFFADQQDGNDTDNSNGIDTGNGTCVHLHFPDSCHMKEDSEHAVSNEEDQRFVQCGAKLPKSLCFGGKTLMFLVSIFLFTYCSVALARFQFHGTFDFSFYGVEGNVLCAGVVLLMCSYGLVKAMGAHAICPSIVLPRPNMFCSMCTQRETEDDDQGNTIFGIKPLGLRQDYGDIKQQAPDEWKEPSHNRQAIEDSNDKNAGKDSFVCEAHEGEHSVNIGVIPCNIGQLAVISVLVLLSLAAGGFYAMEMLWKTTPEPHSWYHKTSSWVTIAFAGLTVGMIAYLQREIRQNTDALQETKGLHHVAQCSLKKP